MANYATLKSAIEQVIKTNGNNEITGALLQQSLLAMINTLGAGYQFIGIATPTTNPGTPDYNVFYIASTVGTYSNFNGLVVNDGEIAILKYNGTWTKDVTGAATVAQVTQLGREIDGAVQNYTTGAYLKSDGSTQNSNLTFYTTEYIPVGPGDTIRYNYVTSYGTMYMVLYDENKSRVGGMAANQAIGYRDTTIAEAGATRFVRASFLLSAKANASVIVNGVEVWKAKEYYQGLREVIGEIEADIANLQAGESHNAEEIAAVKDAIYGEELLSEIGWNQTAANSQLKSIGMSLQQGVTYVLSIRFAGFSSANMNQLSTIALYNGQTEVDGSLLGSGGFGTRTQLSDGEYHTIKYTPNASCDNVRVIFTSAYSADSPVGVVSFKVEKEVENYAKKADLAMIEHLRDLPINVFGDKMPDQFKQKILAMQDDVLVACVGDSITGLIEDCEAQETPSHCPAGAQYKSWVWQLYFNVSKIKPSFDRLDSQRNNLDFFTKNGVWSSVSGTTIDAELQYEYQYEHSVAANTFRSSDAGAYIQFPFDADSFEKCNIIFSAEPNGAETAIEIAGGNGLMLASLDRITWVEANGFAVSQNSNPTNAGWNTLRAAGIAVSQRHRRIWMKKVDGVTGSVTIRYVRSASSAAGKYIYCWGVERYSGPAIFFDNIGRGGRTTEYLSFNITDVFDRNPDLLLYEMPLANETKNGFDTTKAGYTQYFNSSGQNSFKARSNNYQDLPVIILLPHGRSGFFTNENAAKMYSDQVAGDPVAYVFYKRMFAYVKSMLAEYANVAFINLYDQLLNESIGYGLNYVEMFGSQSTYPYSLTADTIHLNQRGANKYNKYLSPLFEV